MLISFVFLISLLALTYCAGDTIGLNRIKCIYKDQISSDDEIISFEYYEGYYRSYHSYSRILVDNSVKMKFLGDSNKDVFLNCYIDPDYRTYVSGSMYHYHIPCSLYNLSQLNEGTYCIQIVNDLIGDISSADFCSDDYVFKVSKSYNIPRVTVAGFSEDQGGCVLPGENVALLANVVNTINDNNIQVALSNTEVYRDDILMQCTFERKISTNSNYKLICTIPHNISEGYYTIYYSSDLSENNQCPSIIMDSFNSIDFTGNIDRVKIFQGNNSYKDIEPKLINVTFENPSQIQGLFNLSFSLNSIPNININSISYNYFNQKNIGIKLANGYGSYLNTNCSLSVSNRGYFYLICNPSSFSKDIRYSLVISEDIIIGYDTSQVKCNYGESSIYSKIIIPSGEFDIFIIYDYENLPYLDCNNNNQGYYFETIKSLDFFCKACSSYCLMCRNENVCTKCLEGFNLIRFKDCEQIKDRIDYQKFKDAERFFQNNECDGKNNYKQLFSVEYSYVITNGENLGIGSVEEKSRIVAKNGDSVFRLNCILDVNPNYIPNGQYYGTCKQSTCTLRAFLNCSFNESVSDGFYDIQINSYNEFCNLLNKAKNEFSLINIYYIGIHLAVSTSDNSIQINYKGNIPNTQNIYVCPNISSQINDCYELKECEIESYIDDAEETVIRCSKAIDYNEIGCISFERIMMEDFCWSYLNESFSYKYCNNSNSKTAFIQVINLFMFLLLLLILF